MSAKYWNKYSVEVDWIYKTLNDADIDARTIDIDILFFNDAIINHQGLKIPHPQMHNRRFVLTPLNEIAENKLHPVFKKKISRLLDICPDNLPVNKFNG